MQSKIFNSHYFSVTWYFRNHFNTFICKKHFLLLSVLKTVVLLNIYVETLIEFFRILWFETLFNPFNMHKQTPLMQEDDLCYKGAIL